MLIKQIIESVKAVPFSSRFRILVNFFLVLTILLLTRKGLTCHPQYYDASFYAHLSQTFLKGHHWSLLNFPNTYRGYLFPFILSTAEHFFDITVCAILINLSCLFLLSFFIVPYLSMSLFKRPLSKAKLILFSLIFLYFWFDYFYYALSDIIAITLLLLAMVLVTKRNYWWFFLGGMAIAAAFNIRPVYQLNLALFILYFTWHLFAKNIKLRGLILFFCGIILIVAPQIIVNHYNNNSFSPFVITNSYNSMSKGGLYLMQIELGLKIEKYETYVGNPSKYPSPQLVYTNGDSFYKQYRSDSVQKNLTDYIKFAILNPVKISQIYLTHLFNGLDIKASTPYLGKIKALLSISLISILNYIVLALGTMNLILNFKNSSNEKNTITKLFLYANIFLPILFILPTAIEVRFFLPLFILLYLSFLQFTCLSTWQNKKSFFPHLFIVGLLIIGALFASNAMSKHIVYDPAYTHVLLN